MIWLSEVLGFTSMRADLVTRRKLDHRSLCYCLYWSLLAPDSMLSHLLLHLRWSPFKSNWPAQMRNSQVRDFRNFERTYSTLRIVFMRDEELNSFYCLQIDAELWDFETTCQLVILEQATSCLLNYFYLLVSA